MRSELEYIYSDEKKPTKMVVWDLGRRCNYDCSYCTGWMHSTTAPFNNLEKFKDTAAFIDGYYSIYEQFHKVKFRPTISFTGGEPAVNPDFFPLVEHLREEYPHWQLNLTTNGTWSQRRGKFLFDNMDSITVSYHCEGNDKQRQLVRDNLVWMHDKFNKNRLKVNVMMHMDHWEDCIDLIETVLKPHGIKYIPRTIGDDGRNRYEWFEDMDGVMRRTSHKYTDIQMEWIKGHWQHENGKVGDRTELRKAIDGDVRKIGRPCCGGRCMTVKRNTEATENDSMFIDQSNFEGWHCMVNWFFLHIEEDKDVAYHHQTCMAKTSDTPEVAIGPLLQHVTTFTPNRGPICNLSRSALYLAWLEEKVHKEGRPPTMVCPNKHCGCGICVPKAKSSVDFDMLTRKYING